MKRVHFFQLPRSVQDRFIQASGGQTVPVPILARQLGRPFPWAWAVTGTLGLLVFVGLLRWGYGDLDSDVAIAPSYLFVYYCLAPSVALYCIMQAVARYLESRQLPFYLGKYVFPSGLIDATRYKFCVHPIAELATVEVNEQPGVSLAFQDGTRESFKTSDRESAEAAKQALLTAQRELTAGNVSVPGKGPGTDDPLTEPRFANPLAPTKPLTPPVPVWRKWTPVVAMLAGVGVGLLSGTVRNRSSERALFASAHAQGTAAAYRAYLQRGGRRPEVGSQLLPYAELSEIKQRGSLAELERYAQRRPDSPIKPAIDHALRQALLAEIKQSKGSLAALDRFVADHPSHGLVQREVVASRRSVLKGVLATFSDEHAAKSEKVIAFFGHLVDHLAEHRPEVEVRFQRLVPNSVARADEAVRSSPHFAQVMLPSQYFNEEKSKERTDAIYDALKRRFDMAFPADALRLQRGNPLGPEAKPPDQPQNPTLYISHSTNMGHGIPNVRPNGMFVGIGFVFDARFVIPGKKSELEMKYSIWRLPDLYKLRKGKITIPEIYPKMGDSAYESFESRVVRWLFRREKK